MKLVFLVILTIVKSVLQAQTGYAINDVTGDFPVNKILNSPTSSSSFLHLKDRLLIVDFFGTWCVPCVRALPKLTGLQKKFKDKIRVLLVSEEPQSKVGEFIAKQTGFSFPVIIDEERRFIKSFQPPSYPYTVIVGKNGKVLAIPSQEEMTEENIEKWLILQQVNNDSVMVQTNKTPGIVIHSANETKQTVIQPSQNSLVQLSQDFMYAAKTEEETLRFIAPLQQLSMADLQSMITTDDEKKAFWINLYNAYTQVALKKNPEQYTKRGKFFGNKFIEIAGSKFSLDDIEHGILRRSKVKWNLGYFNKLFPDKTEKQLRVSALDYRLHFALNCGAKSCPPIAFYKSENINQQLDLATKAYLRSEVIYDEAANMVKLPTLMSWFRRDFGSKKKMIELLRELSIVPAGKNPKIKFKDYDWTLYLQNYK